MKPFNLKRELTLWVLILIPFIYAAVNWAILPNQVPTHWGISGEPDSWGGKTSILLLPGLNVFCYLLFLLMPVIDPRKTNYTNFPDRIFKIRLLLTVYFAVTGISIIYGGTINNWSFLSKIITSGIFILLAFMGNYMINIKPSWFIGIRNPWTLSNDNVWKQTHLVFGRLMFYGSMLCFVISFFLQGQALVILTTSFLLITVVFSYAYSFWLFKKENNNTGSANA